MEGPVRFVTMTMTLAFMLLASLGVATAQAQDGSIVAWGENWDDDGDVPSPNAGFVAVAAGVWHSLGLKSDGTIVAWGSNYQGQCNIPSPNAGFVAIAAGRFHSLGLRSDGTIAAWGSNAEGACNVPTPNTDFTAVAAVGDHSLGLKSDGTIVAWGSNISGQCNVPAPNADFVAVAGGGDHSLGLKSDGTIVAWGWNAWGQCTVPPPNAGFVAVAGGGYHSLGVKFDGTLVVWGDNSYGQLNLPTPNTGFVAVAGGFAHSLGLRSDGTTVAWGLNDFGQCIVPSPNAGFVAVAGGGVHSLGIRSGGTISGACCHHDATCTLTLQAACQSPSIWPGAGTTCTPNPCAPTPVLLESWATSSLAEGLQIRWELPLGTTGALYRAWRDPMAGPRDSAPTPEAVLVSSAWISASAEGIIEILDREAPRGMAVRYFLEMSANDGRFIGPVEARWDPPAAAWSVGPTPFRFTVRLTPPGSGPARAEIFDPAGRLVRTLVRIDGSAPMEWNGRDEADRNAPAGAYIVRVRSTASASEAVARVVKIR